MIAIVDYGLGNVHAIANIYKRLNIPAVLANAPDKLSDASHIVLPGVGAFDWAMSQLDDSGMRGALESAVCERRTPVLGICVGMQMLAQRSDEGKHQGLGWIDAEVRKFDVSRMTTRTRLPHMGWNDVRPRAGSALFAGMEHDATFYFLHSYYFAPRDPADVLAQTDYHGAFACAVQSGNVYGVQFHPEKSHRWGISLLKNFAQV